MAAIITATTACSTLRANSARTPASKAHLLNGRVFAANELNPAIDLCVQRTEGFLGRNFTPEQTQRLCQSATLDEPAGPLMCFEKSSEVIPGITLTDD